MRNDPPKLSPFSASKRLQIGLASIVAILFATLAKLPSAQEADAEVRDDNAQVVGVCMINEHRGSTLTIIVPQRDAKGMRGKGFKRIPCPSGKRLADSAELLEWRDKICTAAANGSQVFQKQFEGRYGERPAVLCGMAEQVSGQWKRKKEAAQ